MSRAPERRCIVCRKVKPRTEFKDRARKCRGCVSIPPPSANRLKPRACMHCHEVKPPDAFDFGPGGRRRKGVCRECEAREAAEREQRQAERRTTWKDPRTGRMVRRCSGCREVKPLATAFGWLNRAHTQRQWICRQCVSKRQTERRRARVKDPELAEAIRARERFYKRRWKARNPERHLAGVRRRIERRKLDPEQTARRQEADRMRYRLRAERNGTDPAEMKRARGATMTVEGEMMPTLPALPLAEAIGRALRRRPDSTVETVCGEIGIPARTYTAWRAGERQSVQFDVADRVLTRLGLLWFDAYDADRFPEAHARAEELFG